MSKAYRINIQQLLGILVSAFDQGFDFVDVAVEQEDNTLLIKPNTEFFINEPEEPPKKKKPRKTKPKKTGFNLDNLNQLL